MPRRVLVALLWGIAVVAGVAIAALSHTLSAPDPAGAPLLRQPALWPVLLVLAVTLAVALWWRRRQPAE